MESSPTPSTRRRSSRLMLTADIAAIFGLGVLLAIPVLLMTADASTRQEAERMVMIARSMGAIGVGALATTFVCCVAHGINTRARRGR